jgi:REP element-mobilizing transposase RayT
MEVIMRQKRKLAEHVWYKVETAINNREPVFQLGFAVVLLCRVLIEAKGKFPFEICGLVIGDEWLSFYNQAADGYELPKIMQWMKQTFSCRFNVKTGRSGHVWGDRYWSEILVKEPPPGAEKVDWAWVKEMAKKKIPAG